MWTSNNKQIYSFFSTYVYSKYTVQYCLHCIGPAQYLSGLQNSGRRICALNAYEIECFFHCFELIFCQGFILNGCVCLLQKIKYFSKTLPPCENGQRSSFLVLQMQVISAKIPFPHPGGLQDVQQMASFTGKQQLPNDHCATRVVTSPGSTHGHKCCNGGILTIDNSFIGDK